MNASLAIVAREIRHYRLVFLGALLTVILILLIASTTVGRWTLEDSAEVCGMLAVAAALIVGTVLGGVLAGNDLQRNRSTFWLTRPLALWMLYGSKILAAWLITIGATAVIALPAIVMDPAVVFEGSNALLVSTLALIGVALGCSFTVLLRARSWAIFVTLGVLAAVGWTVDRILQWIPFQGIASVIQAYAWIAILILVSALLLGRGVAFSRGRYDARIQAWIVGAALSIGAALVLAMLAAHAAWFRSLDFHDMEEFSAAGASVDGSEVIVTGYQWPWMPWGMAGVLDLETGRATGLPAGSLLAEGTLAQDELLWLQPVAVGSRQHRLHRTTADGRTTATGFEFLAPGAMDVSPSGRIVAVSSAARTDLVDPDRGRIGVIPASSDDVVTAVPVFESDAALRLHELSGDRNRWVIRRVDLRTLSTVRTATLDARFFWLNRDLSRVIARATDEPLFVADASSGEPLFAFAPGTRLAVPLADGGYAALRRKEGLNLDLVTEQGEIVRSVRLPDRTGMVLAGEIRPQVVLVGYRDLEGRAARLVDLATGETLREHPGVWPLFWMQFNTVIVPPQSPAIGAVTSERGVFRVDPETLELIPLIKTD